mgnify:CR=1 FL=1
MGMKMYGEKATAYCLNSIERKAKYDFKWTNGWGLKFNAFIWKDSGKKVIVMLGDEIKFQNGFGAMEIHNYRCDIDIASGKLVGVMVRRGRL